MTGLASFNVLKAAYFSGHTGTVARELAAWEQADSQDPYLRFFRATMARHQLAPGSVWSDDFDAGFACKLRFPDLAVPGRRWRGQPLAGSTLTVWAEDGLGDFVRHARHIDRLTHMAAQVNIFAPLKIRPLMAACFPACRVLDTLDGLGADDWHIPSGSLDGLFWHAWENPQPSGYLRLPAGQKQRDQNPLHPYRIGLCTRSLKRSGDRNFNYTDLDALAPVFNWSQLEAHSLQYADDRDELAAANAVFARPIIEYPDLDFYDDLLALAQTILGMDMVLATSTLVADLSSALGVRTIRFHGKAHVGQAVSVDDPDGSFEEGPDPDRSWYSDCTSIIYREAGQPWPAFFERVRVMVEAEVAAATGAPYWVGARG